MTDPTTASIPTPKPDGQDAVLLVHAMTTDTGRMVATAKGLSRRDLFAAIAMHAIVTKHGVVNPEETDADKNPRIAAVAVSIADELIADLSKAPVQS
jgi:hypothetical protein